MSYFAGIQKVLSKVGQPSFSRGGALLLARVIKTQSTFEGLSSIGFAADSSHGFGYDKDGNLVLVKPDEMSVEEYCTSEETRKIIELAEKAHKNKDLSDATSPRPDLV